MRIGAFIGILTALLVVAGFILPAPYRGLSPIEGLPPPPPVDAICIALTVDVEDSSVLYGIPPQIVLLPDTLWTKDVHRARGLIAGSGGDLAWRYAGMDSVDIGGHHTATVRVPIRVDAGAGRAVPYHQSSILVALLTTANEVSVFVKRETCDGAASRAA